MPIKFIATCLTASQSRACASLGVEVGHSTDGGPDTDAGHSTDAGLGTDAGHNTAAGLDTNAGAGTKAANVYATTYGQISPGCVTDYSIHCFNSQTLGALKSLGVHRATLHPELNLAQIRDMEKCIDTEAIIYGKLPLMRLGNPQIAGNLVDRTGAIFHVQGDKLYNSVPIFMADKLKEVEKAGITHGRLIFTTEDAEEVRMVIKAYMYRKPLGIAFTRGKFYSKV